MVRQNKLAIINIITITTVAIVNEKRHLITYIIAINALDMAIFLRHVTFSTINGLPTKRVLNITFSCHKIYTDALPEKTRITIIKVVFFPTKLKYFISHDDENGTNTQHTMPI
jgi:hypothetical protein